MIFQTQQILAEMKVYEHYHGIYKLAWNPSNSLIAKTGLYYLTWNFAVPPSTALPSISLPGKLLSRAV